MTVIEELTITVEPSDRAAYLERDAEDWTPYLAERDGFLGKEIWLPDDEPGTIVLIIRWASMEQWKRISPAQVAAVDQQMGALQPLTLACRSYRVSG